MQAAGGGVRYTRRAQEVGRMRFRPVILPLLVLALPATLLAQPSTPPPQRPPADPGFGAEIRATAVEVVIEVRDAAGQVPAALRPEDFQVLEDGAEQPVIGVERIGAAAAAPGAAPSAAAPAPAPAGTTQAVSGSRTVPWQIVAYFDLTLSATPTVRGAAAAL